MTKHEIELLIRMQTNAQAAGSQTADALKAIADQATKTGGSLDVATKAIANAGTAATKSAAETKKLADQSASLKDQVTAAAGRVGVSTTALAGMATAAGAAAVVVGGLVRTFAAGFEHTWKLGESFGDLAQSSGASVEGLQRLRYGAATTGTDLQKLLGAAKDLSERLGEGNAGAANAMRKLGVSIADFQRLGADQQVLTLNTALQKVTGETQRAQIQAALFGDQWRAVAPAMSADLTALGDKADRLGLVMDKSTVESIRKMDNAIETMKVTGEGMLANFMSPFIESIGDLADKMPDLNIDLGTFSRALGHATKAGGDILNPINLLNGLIRALGDEAEDAAEKISAAAEDAAEKWSKLERSMTRSGAGSGADRLATARVMVDNLTEAQRKNIDAQLKLGDSTDKVAQAMGLSKDVIKLYQDQTRDAEKETKRLRQALIDLEAETLNQAEWDAHVAALKRESAAIAEVAQIATIGAAALQALNQARGGVASLEFQGLLPGVTNGIPDGLGTQVWTPGISPGLFSPQDKTMPKVAGFSDTYGWNSMKGALPGQLISAFSGGNVGGGLGAIAGGMGGKALGGIASALAGSGFLSTGLASAMGLAGNVLPVLGPIVGGMLGKYIGGLFGPSKNAIADKEATGRIQTTQAGLIDRYGSVEKIAGMTQAGAELAAGWGHQGRGGEAAFKAQVKAFEESLERQSSLKSDLINKERDLASLEAERAALVGSLVPRWDNVKGALDRYGISLDGAGIKVQQLGATEAWTSMLNDIQLLERAGVDVGGMLFGMKDEISKMVQESMRLGTEIPANMRPYIEELANSGQLLDANGEKITDLSNIKWGDKVKTEAEKTEEKMAALDTTIQGLKDALADVVTALRDLLPAAAEAGASAIEGSVSRAGRTVRDVTRGMQDDFADTEDAATGTAHGHSPTGIKEITIVSKEAGKAVENLGKISYKTFTTMEETAGYWARTQVASFDKLGDILQSASRDLEDILATPLQRQLNAIDRARQDQLEKLGAFVDDPRYAETVAMINRAADTKSSKAVWDERAEAAEKKKKADETEADRLERVAEAWARIPKIYWPTSKSGATRATPPPIPVPPKKPAGVPASTGTSPTFAGGLPNWTVTDEGIVPVVTTSPTFLGLPNWPASATPTYSPTFLNFPGAANGVLAGGKSGPKFRVFGEREPELGGSVDFMSRVMAKAMQLSGGMFGAGGMRLENVVVIDGKVAARALSGPLVRDLHARGLIK